MLVATALLKDAPNREPKCLWTARQGGCPVHIRECVGDDAEAAFVAESLKTVHDSSGLEWDKCSILYRQARQSRSLEAALRLQQVPFVVVGGQVRLKRWNK